MTIKKKIKLNFRFHNPNTVEDTADYIVGILMESNRGKLEEILQEAAEKANGTVDEGEERKLCEGAL